MIRWLVKKVVKYTLEELKSSDEFAEIIGGVAISGATSAPAALPCFPSK